MARELLRVIAVIALLGAAAALATPRGRLPLALRGLSRLLARDRAMPHATPDARPTVSPARRLFAFALVLLAVLLAFL